MIKIHITKFNIRKICCVKINLDGNNNSTFVTIISYFSAITLVDKQRGSGIRNWESHVRKQMQRIVKFLLKTH